MRKREEHRLREKLEIPNDYELHILRVDSSVIKRAREGSATTYTAFVGIYVLSP